MKNVVRFLALGAVAATVALPWSAHGQQQVKIEADGLSTVIRGSVVTGFNRYLGQPRFNLGAPIGTFGFTTVGGFDPHGSVASPIIAGTPKSTYLATSVDPNFLGMFGLTATDVDPARLNVPLRGVTVNVGPDGVTRVPLRGTSSAAQTEASQAEPADAITLRDWEKGAGTTRIRCSRTEAWVELDVQRLIPNRLYTVWAIFGGDSVTAIPLGGAPNIIVTDESGDGSLRRRLNFCPLKKNAQRPLVDIEVLFHGDQQNYGAVPELGLAGKAQSLFAGAVTFAHLDFPVTLAN